MHKSGGHFAMKEVACSMNKVERVAEHVAQVQAFLEATPVPCCFRLPTHVASCAVAALQFAATVTRPAVLAPGVAVEKACVRSAAR